MEVESLYGWFAVVRLIVDAALADRLWRGVGLGVDVVEDERGVRGRKGESFSKARETASMLLDEEGPGESARKFKLRVRNEGVRECLEDL